MRIDLPGVDGPQQHWAEIRSTAELTGADEEAWGRLIAEAVEKRAEEEANAPAGAERPPLRMPAGWTRQREDDLLASLITAWSFSDPSSVPHIELPYSAEARKRMPLTALQELREKVKPHVALLEGERGPKEPEPPTSTTNGSGSSNGSRERSENPLPDSPQLEPATAST